MIPLPRAILPWVLMRDTNADMADINRALEDVSSQLHELFGPHAPLVVSWYRSFLELVRDSEPERTVRKIFETFWSIPPQELGQFFTEHPEIATPEAIAILRTELEQIPSSDQDEDPGVGQYRALLQARLMLIEGFSQGLPAAQLIEEYIARAEGLSQHFSAQLNHLQSEIAAHPGADGIPYLRDALDMAIGLHIDDLEAALSADLGARLGQEPITDSQIIEEVIRLLERALSLTREDSPGWAIIAGNLGNAYKSRVRGDPTDNWETALNLIWRACEAVDRQVNPHDWAVNQTNYGFALTERPGGSSTEEINRGIEHIRAGLEERSPDLDVRDWAYSLVNLGFLHACRNAEGDTAIAKECYQQALSRLRPQDDLPLWATLQNNLASLLLAEDPPDLEGAEHAIRSALEEVDSSTDPLRAGRLIGQLARVEEGRRGPTAAEVLRLRSQALELLDPLLAPASHLDIGYRLADAYTQFNDWMRAADTYATLLTAFEGYYITQTSPRGRRALLAEYPRLARWAAYVFARVGRPERAVEVIESGRARELSVVLGRATAELGKLDEIDRRLAERYRAALSLYRAALGGAAQMLSDSDARNEISSAEREMRQTLNDIRDIPGFERFLQSMTLDDIAQSADGHPVIYLINAPWGSYALKVTCDTEGHSVIDSIAVPEVTSKDISHVVLVGPNAEPGLISAQLAEPRVRWSLLQAALRRISEIEPLLKPVAEALSSDQQHIAVVVPTGLLGFVPLPAVRVADQFLDDIGETHLAPSVAVYVACRRRASQQRNRHLVGVADPDGTLPGSRLELAAIRDLFGSDVSTSSAIGPQASRAWVLEHAREASHLHLGCHGASPFDSATGGMLFLAEGDILTTDDLLDGRLNNCRLAVASACQSGQYATTDALDEFVGLPSGFLQAGAACAVASLWPVFDDVTSLLMTRLYALLDPARVESKDQHPVTALREARIWLRQLDRRQADAFRQGHPQLIDTARAPGGLDSPASDCGTDVSLYSLPEFWAAFIAWGC
jgi:CHAT domain-containing protein